MRYAHFAKICEKCGKVPNMRQSHIRVILTCLNKELRLKPARESAEPSLCMCAAHSAYSITNNSSPNLNRGATTN